MIHSVAVGHGQVADHGADFTRKHRLVHQLFCCCRRSQPDFIALPTERHAGGFSTGIVVDDQVPYVMLPFLLFECIRVDRWSASQRTIIIRWLLFMGRLFSPTVPWLVLIPLLLPDQVQNKEIKMAM